MVECVKNICVDWFFSPQSETWKETKVPHTENVLDKKDFTLFDSMYLKRNELRVGLKICVITGIVLAIWVMAMFAMSATGCFAGYSFVVTLPMAVGLSFGSVFLLSVIPGYILRRFNVIEKANTRFYDVLENGNYTTIPEMH